MLEKFNSRLLLSVTRIVWKHYYVTQPQNSSFDKIFITDLWTREIINYLDECPHNFVIDDLNPRTANMNDVVQVLIIDCYWLLERKQKFVTNVFISNSRPAIHINDHVFEELDS